MSKVMFSKTLDTNTVTVEGGFVCERGGVFLPDSEARNAANERRLMEYYMEQKAKGIVYDWEKAKETGKAVLVSAPEPVAPEGIPAPEISEKQPEPVPESVTAPAAAEPSGFADIPDTVKVPVAEKVNAVIQKSVPMVVAVGLLVVTAGAVFVSMDLSRRVQTVNIGGAWGTVLAFIMVLFSTCALTASGMFFRNGKHMTGIMFSIMFVVIVAYSMTNTMKVFFDSYEQTVYTSMESSGADSVYAARKAAIDRQIASNDAQLKSQLETIEYYRKQGWGLSKQNDTLRQLNDEQTRLSSELTELLNSTDAKTVVQAAPKQQFCEFLGLNVFHVPPETVQLILSCFPALFIDLIAPVSLAGASGLLLNKTSKKERKNGKVQNGRHHSNRKGAVQKK